MIADMKSSVKELEDTMKKISQKVDLKSQPASHAEMEARKRQSAGP